MFKASKSWETMFMTTRRSTVPILPPSSAITFYPHSTSRPVATRSTSRTMASGAAISDETARQNPMIEKLIDFIATHDDSFLSKYNFEERTKQNIISALNKFLK